MFQVGDKVGEYEIVAKLKAGGMATLFLGKRSGASGFSRHVAIKVVHEHLAADPTFVQMFVDEALLSSKIQHPNVVHVEQLRQVNGRHFLVMEYVHGCSLAMLLSALNKQRRNLNADLATYVAAKVAEGLHAAHEATSSDGAPLGVVHRDVSPQNILLAYKGHVKLIDFGVAKAAGRASETTGGSLKGKIAYMAPEQAFGKPVDRRADVYALGVVLWEMLTGRRAFKADNDFLMLELVRDPKLPPVRELNPDVPEALEQVIMKATAREPDDRFQSAQALRKALAAAVPTALALDDSDLARLLALMMGDTIRREVEQLPESVSGVKAPSLPVDDGVLRTLTVSAVGLELESSPTLQSVPSAQLVRAAPSTLTPTLTPTVAPTQAKKKSLLFPILVGVIALLAAAAGAVVALSQLRKGEAQEMTATELPVTAARAEAAAEAEAEAEPEAETETETETEPEAETVAEAEAEAEAEPVAEAEAETEPEAAAEPETARPARRRRPRPVRRGGRGGGGAGGVFLADEF